MPTKTDQEVGFLRTYGLDKRAPLLDLTADEVGRLTRPAREERVELLLEESRRIYDRALDVLITDRRKEYLGTAALYSGGNDSTALVHTFRPLIDLAIHANTGIGVEATRRFVRQTCAEWSIPLEERHPPVSYEALVLEHGFPGPGQHFKSYQRLKERAFLSVRADLIPIARSRRDVVVYLAGRRKDESARRSNVPLWEREGAIAWVSPLALWTKLDLNTYRVTRGDVPQNPVSLLLHMSAECLCGSFARLGELAEIGSFYPEVAAEIRALEARVHERCRECNGGTIPHERTSWGWGASRHRARAAARRQLVQAGAMCGTC